MNPLHSTPPSYNPFEPGFRENPYPALARLRRHDPVHATTSGSWVLTRYEDIRFVLSDPRFVIGLDILEAYPAIREEMKRPYNRIIRPQILSADPPAHPRIRSIMAKGFTAARLDALRPLIERSADDCIDKALQADRFDFISSFAYRLPFLVICEVMGVPPAEREPLQSWTHGLMRSTDPTPMTPAELEECNQAALGFREYFLGLASRRSGQPVQTIFDEMLAACDDDQITWEELIANLILLFCAGHDTVVNLFGNGLLALHRNPSQLRLLQEDPTLMRNAVEELLRYDTSVTIARRTATEAVELGGKTIGHGHYVLCCLHAGNRDPEVFADPDRLDILRKNVRPLSFGGGIHYCLGAQLARIEGEIGFSALLRRIPGLELETLDPPWRRNAHVRGLEKLPARCHPAKPGEVPATPAAIYAEVPSMTTAQAVQWLKQDARALFFSYAIQYINWECVEGDILEFGVSVGKSFALLSRLYHENLSHWQYREPVCTGRRVGGFDSFEGLPPDVHPHPRWKAGSFANNYLHGHPSLPFDAPITPESIDRMFDVCGLPRPEIEVGRFEATIPGTIPSKYRKAALVHIDSDLYASAKCVLNGVEPILANGALVLFDDWFMYQGDPNQGEQRALREFLAEHPQWEAIPYQTYSVFCNSFIFRKRS